MEKANVERTLFEMIKNYTNRKAEAIHRSASLREDLGLSSFDMIAMSAEIEESFSITVDNLDVLADIDTFGDLVDIFAEKITQS